MSYIKIDSSNYRHNLSYLSNKLGSIDRLAVVLKDNAYGHGLLEIAKLSCDFGIKKAVVKTEEEALEIQNYFEEIIVLNPNFSHESFTLVINSLEKLNLAKPNQKLHLKIDSGMHRNGIKIEEIEDAYKIITKRDLNITGALTHFRSADELSSELFWQEKEWEKAKDKLKTVFKKKLVFHSANSATLLRKNRYNDDFARCGIAIYGYHEMDKIFGDFDLKPVMSLWGEKVSTRKLQKSQRVGYGGVYKTKKDIKITTYDIGYGDGFFRYDGLGDLKTACNKPICGRISMDYTSIESDSDEICIFDDAKKVAKYFKTISYEIMTRLSPSIRRIVI